MRNVRSQLGKCRNRLRPLWDARNRDTLTAALFQIESALSVQLANAMQPDRERSYLALEKVRSVLTNVADSRNDRK